MHIALLTHYFPPEVNAPAQRAMDHARHWVDAGHKVTIVTAAPSHPYGIVYQGYDNRTSKRIENGIEVLRLKTMLGANSGKFTRIINYLSYPLAVMTNQKLIGTPDILISTSPQFFCGLAGILVKHRHKKPWILEIRDVWPDSIVAVGAAKPSIATKAVSALARWAYSKADKIVSVSPGFADHFAEYAVADSKISVIPNGIQTSLKPITATFQDFPELEEFNGKTIVAFIGTLGMAHGLESLLQAAKIVEDENIGFLLVGSGARSDQIKSLLTSGNHNNVLIMDQLPRDRILQLWSLVDISLVHLKKNDVFHCVIPTKMLEAMAMKKAIVLGVEGTAAKILAEANAGIAVEPENPREIAEAVLKLANDSTLAAETARNGRAYVKVNFDRKKMAESYLDLMLNLQKD